MEVGIHNGHVRANDAPVANDYPLGRADRRATHASTVADSQFRSRLQRPQHNRVIDAQRRLAGSRAHRASLTDLDCRLRR
jgi:hypothetical protein